MPQLIGATLLVTLIITAVLAIPVTAGVVGGILVLGDLWGGGSASGAGALLILLAVAVGSVGACWIAVRTLFVPACVVLEGQTVIASVRRGWDLSKGRFWPILGIYLLAAIVVNVISGVVATPVMVVAFLAEGLGPLAVQVITVIASTLTLMVTLPFSAAVTALLYLDARIRSEGLDLALMRAAEE
jgi:membrane-anchored glycerophosphoryl diester phosphodiesterase (GDPDase)